MDLVKCQVVSLLVRLVSAKRRENSKHGFVSKKKGITILVKVHHDSFEGGKG